MLSDRDEALINESTRACRMSRLMWNTSGGGRTTQYLCLQQGITDFSTIYTFAEVGTQSTSSSAAVVRMLFQAWPQARSGVARRQGAVTGWLRIKNSAMLCLQPVGSVCVCEFRRRLVCARWCASQPTTGLMVQKGCGQPCGSRARRRDRLAQDKNQRDVMPIARRIGLRL